MTRLRFHLSCFIQIALYSALLAGSMGGYAIADQVNGSLGKAMALREEARTYEHGEGVKREQARALQLYCEAARLGDVEAQYSLGWMYANGRGMQRDDATAAFFFGMAAKAGHSQAQRMLKQVGDPVSKPPECLFDSDGGDIIAQAVAERRKIMEMVLKLAPEYGVHPRLAMAVIRAESNFNPSAISPKNAQGLMQLIPETAQRFNVKKPFDPEQNIRGGLAYLRWLLAYYKGDVILVAAAYNAGERAVNNHAGIPPYSETQGYVKRIREIYKHDEHPYDPAVTDPSPDLPRIASRRVM
jgi:TPR repeat protein